MAKEVTEGGNAIIVSARMNEQVQQEDIKPSAGAPRKYKPCLPGKQQHAFRNGVCSYCKQKKFDMMLNPPPEVVLDAAMLSDAFQENPPPNTVLSYGVNLPDYSIHENQRHLIDSPFKRKMVKAGRRGGKTTAAMILAVLYFLQGKRVRYAAPVADQTDRFWALVKEALQDLIDHGVYSKNETRRVIEPLGSTRQQIRAVTAWNVDALRGDACDLLILEEYQLMDENAWGKVGQPMLIDYDGDALLIFTPPSLETRATKAIDKLHASKMFKECKERPDWLCLHFRSMDNPFLSEHGLEEVAKGMTTLAYRQEILAEDVEEIPGAIWTRQLIEDTRVHSAPQELRRIVVGVDPSGSNTSETETGIVACGEGFDGHYYVLQDRSDKGAPLLWASKAVGLYHEMEADRLVAEQNYGGAMVKSTIQQVDETVSYKDVHATRSKTIRAQPICALFEQGRAHIVGEMPQLEEQMVSYLPGDKSPDRLDAMVWAMSELLGLGSLGLVDLFKSGRVEQLLGLKPVPMTPINPATVQAAHQIAANAGKFVGQELAKIAGASTMAAIATNDQTPRCPKCAAVTIVTIAGGEQKCNSCGNQWWKEGTQPQVNFGPNRNTRFIKVGA